METQPQLAHLDMADVRQQLLVLAPFNGGSYDLRANGCLNVRDSSHPNTNYTEHKDVRRSGLLS